VTTDPNIRQLIRALVEKIKREYQPEKIIMFGSYASGQPDRDSDLDFFIVKETPERPIDREVRVAEIVSDPCCLVPFDPLVLTPQELKERIEMGDQFILEILREGEVLYGE
jgi:predicted nucleotidyltransferase